MLRLYYAKKRLHSTLNTLLYIYKNCFKKTLWHNSTESITKTYNYNLMLNQPKRQQLFYFYNLKQIKGFSYSVGMLFSERLQGMKFYKRSVRNIVPLVAFLAKTLFKKKKKIYFLYIVNFNYKQYLFLKKFYHFVSPQVELLSISKAYYLKKKYKRRIKRSVLHLLKKQ